MAHSLVNIEYPVTEIPQEQFWGENYMVSFYDRENDIGGLFSLGRWVIQPEIWRSCLYLGLPNDRVLVSKNFGKSQDPKVPSSGVFWFNVAEVGKEIRYFYDGPMNDRTFSDLNTIGLQVGKNDLMQFELVFESDKPIWDMHADVEDRSGDQTENKAANFNSPDGHVEQNGTVSGTIRFGDETYTLHDAPGTRDHSRGVRNLTNYKGHVWTNGHFPGGRSFNAFGMKTHGFEGVAVQRAAVTVEGTMYDASMTAETTAWLERPGQLFEPSVVVLESPELGRIELGCKKVINSIPMVLYPPADYDFSVPAQVRDKKCVWINEQKVIWRWDGEEGNGHLERGNSAFSTHDPDWLNNFRNRI